MSHPQQIKGQTGYKRWLLAISLALLLIVILTVGAWAASAAELSSSSTSKSVLLQPTLPPPADLELIKHDIGYDPAVPGGQVVYNVQVCNYGPATVPSIVIEDTFGAGLIFAQTNAPGCNVAVGTAGPAAFTCEIAGALASGQCLGFEFTFDVDPNYQGATVENCATVSSPGVFDPVPDPHPNSDCESTAVVPPTAVGLAGLQASATNSPAPAAATGLAAAGLAAAFGGTLIWLRRRR